VEAAGVGLFNALTARKVLILLYALLTEQLFGHRPIFPLTRNLSLHDQLLNHGHMKSL
jgi:hypothetical protein